MLSRVMALVFMGIFMLNYWGDKPVLKFAPILWFILYFLATIADILERKAGAR